MEPKNQQRKRPEEKIQDALIYYLRSRNWIVKSTHGNIFQAGFPDLYCTHKTHGIRWVEVKLPDMKGSRWTKAQEEWFPQFAANGTGIWILTAANDSEYKKLFEPPNFMGYYIRHGW